MHCAHLYGGGADTVDMLVITIVETLQRFCSSMDEATARGTDPQDQPLGRALDFLSVSQTRARHLLEASNWSAGDYWAWVYHRPDRSETP